MSGFTRWMWRDEVIHDIRQWARARGEQMVQYDEHRRGVAGHHIVVETSQGEAPESFWNGYMQTADHWYTETGRVTP